VGRVIEEVEGPLGVGSVWECFADAEFPFVDRLIEEGAFLPFCEGYRDEGGNEWLGISLFFSLSRFLTSRLRFLLIVVIIVNHQCSPGHNTAPPVRTCEKTIGGFTGVRNPVKYAILWGRGYTGVGKRRRV